MIKISETLQKKFKQDSVDKELIISFRKKINGSGVNFYFGSFNESIVSHGITLSKDSIAYMYSDIKTAWEYIFSEYVHREYLKYEEYLCFSANINMAHIGNGEKNDVALLVVVEQANGEEVIYQGKYVNVSKFGENAIQMYVILPTKDLRYIKKTGIINISEDILNCSIQYSKYQVEIGKQTEMPTIFKKSPIFLGENIEEVVGDDKTAPEDIRNVDLLSESFSLNEALCSQNNIKFGLCESSYVEFTISNRAENFLNKRMSVSIDIKDGISGQWNLLDGTANPYKLDSDNLRYTGWNVAPALISGQNIALSFDYAVHQSHEIQELGLFIKLGDQTYFNEKIPSLSSGSVKRKIFVPSNQNANYMVQVAQTDSALHPITLSNVMLTFNFFNPWNISENDYSKIEREQKTPLGVFTVANVKKNSNMKTKTITAYDDLTKLNQNAEDWYTQYMFHINTEDASRNGAEFSRQMFSTYYNLAFQLGIETGAEEKRLISTFTYSEVKYGHLVEKYLRFNQDPDSVIPYLKYAKFTFTNLDTSKLFQVQGTNISNYTDQFIFSSMLSSYFESFDNRGRGVLSKASVLVEEIRQGLYTNRFLCDFNNYFMISPTTTTINIYIPFYTCTKDKTIVNALLEEISVYEINRSIELKNGWVRLMYYNWGTKEIFQSPSGITARDVFRSLIEVCGAFYKLDRYGKPQFKYCTKSAVYPSTTLYPDYTLYPRGNDGMFTRSHYVSYWYEDYEVQDFGKIQIKKEQSDNANPVVEWEYLGDANKKNTYIIDDNIFYCSKEMEYEYDSMPEVSEMLKNMFESISDLGYVPCDVTAKGLPYLETGDRITLLTEDGATETFIFSRTLTGISALKDNYESKGDECNEEISDYGYKQWKEGV